MCTQEELTKAINDYIDHLPYNPQPAGLYDPIKYVLAAGGKRMRCLLMLMAYNMYKEDVSSIFPNAAALETYHNFTLLHDDLMDRADMRRGRPTVHIKWNDNAAILSGDAMIILAYQLMAQHEGPNQSKVLKTFSEAALGVCEGQQYDMEFEQRDDVTEEEYLEMIRLKTSVLLAAALKIGALLAGASDEDAELLYEFGEKVGLAFQLQDDYLDVYGDPKVFGKKIGGDILCNKKTFMLINTLNLCNEEQKAVLQAWMDKKDFVAEEKIKAVTDIYDAVNIKQVCQSKMTQLYDEGFHAFHQLKVGDERKQILKDYVEQLMGRNF